MTITIPNVPFVRFSTILEPVTEEIAKQPSFVRFSTIFEKDVTKAGQNLDIESLENAESASSMLNIPEYHFFG